MPTNDKEYEKLGIVRTDYIDNTRNAPEWFNKISSEYLLLDMHGYQEDRVNIKKGRKETFKNTTEDAFHAAFASTCNFYVINDNKSYKKTNEIYKRLNINTLVLKPDEFVNYYKKYLNLKDKDLNLTLPGEILKNGQYVESKIDKATLRTYYFPYFFFDFFNKAMLLIPDNGDTMILLSQNSPSNHKVYLLEITRLVSKICEILGSDIENIGEVKDDEFSKEEWVGRKWKLTNNLTIRLARISGHFQLYYDQKKPAGNMAYK